MSALTSRVLLFLFICSFAFSSYSCHKDDDPVSTADVNAPIMPLKVGNRWVFKSELLDTSGAVFFSGNDTSTIGLIETIVGRHVYVISHYFRSGLYLKADGLYTFDVPSQTDVCLFRWPAAAGDHFTSWVNGLPMTVTSTNVRLTTPAGTFQCVQYDDMYSTYYFSPGVGLISYSSKPVHIRWTLQSYSLP